MARMHRDHARRGIAGAGSAQPPANVAATVEPALKDEDVPGKVNRHSFDPLSKS
jgi:hypothetical protein